MSREKTLKPGEMMEMDEYMKKRSEYENSFLFKINHRTRIAMHPFLLTAISIQNICNGYKSKILFDKKVPSTRKPIIFCITHIGKHDIEICSQLLKKHYYLLSGDFENLHGTFEGNFLELNGIIYLNKYDKEDKTKSKKVAVDILRNAGNVMWFPEGIWNLSPNQPVLNLPFGIIEVAIKSNAVIVPVAIEQYAKEFFVNIGEIFKVEKYLKLYKDEFELKLRAIEDLRNIMATLKWECWEQFQPSKRIDLKDNYFDLFVEERLKEWHGFTYDDVRAREFRPKGMSEYEDVFEHLNDLKPNKNNAFLFDKRLK